MATSEEMFDSGIRWKDYLEIVPVYAAGAASCLLTVEIVPQVPQRTLTRLGSSVIPMIWVRWLPHFGQK
jgi:hypothetical protein